MPDKFVLEPLSFTGLADYHLHCDYSVDAVGSIDNYCRAAISRGLAEICFTTHYDSDFEVNFGDNFINVEGERRKVSAEALEPYVADVRAAHEKFYPSGLSVRLGLEFGWYPGCEEEAIRLKERYDFDHFLGSVHSIKNRCLCSKKSFTGNMGRYSAAEYVELYFQTVTDAARSGLFDALAHVGVHMRQGLGFFGEELIEMDRPYLEELLSALLETDTALEINTGAVRHGQAEYYPRMAVINAARKAGIRLPFLGSDAHRPEDVGYDFEAAAALADNMIVQCGD